MMKKTVLNLKVSALALALGAALSPAVQAQTAAEELQQLRATTQALINTLVESGLLTREKAAAMLKQVRTASVWCVCLMCPRRCAARCANRSRARC